MFRVITKTDPMIFFILCDNRHCNFVATARVTDDQLEPETYNKTQTDFTDGLAKAGWTVGLNAQVCPECTMDQQRAVLAQRQRERDRQLVQLAVPGTNKALADRVAGSFKKNGR